MSYFQHGQDTKASPRSEPVGEACPRYSDWRDHRPGGSTSEQQQSKSKSRPGRWLERRQSTCRETYSDRPERRRQESGQSTLEIYRRLNFSIGIIFSLSSSDACTECSVPLNLGIGTTLADRPLRYPSGREASSSTSEGGSANSATI